MSEGTAQKVGIVLQGPSPVPPPPRYFTLRTRFKYIPAGATATVAAGAREGGEGYGLVEMQRNTRRRR